jgi:hypothetical protein
MLEELKQTLIELRDAALDCGRMDWAVSLSHHIAAISQGCYEQVKEYQPDSN